MKVTELAEQLGKLAGQLGELVRLGYGDLDVVMKDDGTVSWTLGAEPPEPMRNETPPA